MQHTCQSAFKFEYQYFKFSNGVDFNIGGLKGYDKFFRISLGMEEDSVTENALTVLAEQIDILKADN